MLPVTLRQDLASLTEEQLAAWVDALPPEAQAYLPYAWEEVWARPKQVPPPGDWTTWLIMAGRGFGKTRTGAEWVIRKAQAIQRGSLVGRTAADARDVMILGESGILERCPPWFRPRYVESKRRLEWPNGARTMVYSAEEPDVFRGPQHGYLWGDEFAAWKYLQDALDNIFFGLRLGRNPQLLLTTTPRPLRILQEWMRGATETIEHRGVRHAYNPTENLVITNGTTYENLSNLAPAFQRAVLSKYEGTTVGAQELLGQLLADVAGALWKRALIDQTRLTRRQMNLDWGGMDSWDRVVVSIDPSGTKNGDEVGLVVEAMKRYGREEHYFLLEDASGGMSPSEWAARAIALYDRYGADRIVAEVNFGADMVEHTIRTTPGGRRVPFRRLNASRGKKARAEPIVGLYEQARVHHVGNFVDLEDEQCTWVPGESDWSPGRMDAHVWAVTELAMLRGSSGGGVSATVAG